MGDTVKPARPSPFSAPAPLNAYDVQVRSATHAAMRSSRALLSQTAWLVTPAGKLIGKRGPATAEPAAEADTSDGAEAPSSSANGPTPAQDTGPDQR